MLAKVFSGTTVGLDGVLIEIEIDIPNQGLPQFAIVGLPDKAVEEAKERVRSAIKNIGCDFPGKRITVNLAPADLPKMGTCFDLPIAVGILIASGQLSPKLDLRDSLFIGELSLDGNLRPTPGILSIALLAKEKNLKKVFVPKANAKEAAIIKGLEVYPVSSLKELFDHQREISAIKPHPHSKVGDLTEEKIQYEFDMTDVKGQEHAKRALEIAAAGGHNIILKGPPGAGKTLLARTFPSILPELTLEETLEVTKIYSVCGLLTDDIPVVKKRPFRSPHHTASYIGLVGGGTRPKPGEISLAHRGVLFLDEFGEFPRQVLESLRQPLEDGFITVSRAQGTLKFPAKFVLVAASNPCPQGFTLFQS